jgi:hypothetical protein
VCGHDTLYRDFGLVQQWSLVKCAMTYHFGQKGLHMGCSLCLGRNLFV